MAEITTLQQTLTAWADIVIDIWINRMASLGVHNPYYHAESFVHHIISSSGGSLAKIEFTFDYFLKFTDMGVGNGVSIATRNTVVTSRLQKMWFSKTFLLEVRKLANIMAKNFGFQGVLKIVENTDDNALRWDKSHINTKI